MKSSTRKQFLQTSGLLLAGAFVNASFDFKKNHPHLSFSTLGCPDWDFQKITDFAVQHDYNGIEIRGLLREMDLTKCKEFNTAENRSATMRMMKEKRLQFVDLGSSANIHIADVTDRKKNLDDARRFINLAEQLNCPFVRVFPGFPKDQDRKQTMDLMIKGLLELGEFAKGSKVGVLMETHGDVVKTDDLETIMQGAHHEHTGLVWDVTNMWTITKEPPVEVYKRLKKYIRHTHIKDAKLVDGKVKYDFLMGQGEVPIFEAIDALAKGGYKGYYSFEWEKLWHPEIAEPEIALADYPKVMKEHFK